MRLASGTPARPDSIPFTGTTSLLSMGAIDVRSIYAYVGWDLGFGNMLPLDEVVGKQVLLDSTQQLLPTLRLGGIDYGPVFRLSNVLRNLPNGFPRTRPARLIYYAKGYGVVGFVEGSILWYRLP